MYLRRVVFYLVYRGTRQCLCGDGMALSIEDNAASLVTLSG
jgi:hypothetical protein